MQKLILVFLNNNGFYSEKSYDFEFGFPIDVTIPRNHFCVGVLINGAPSVMKSDNFTPQEILVQHNFSYYDHLKNNEDKNERKFQLSLEGYQ